MPQCRFAGFAFCSEPQQRKQLPFSRCATANRGLHGTLFGFLFAIIDGAALIAGHASFEWLFVISNAGRIIGGAIGGAIASRNRSAALT